MANYEKLDGDRAKLTIEIDPAAFSAAVETAFHKTAKRYNVPGFRKGHAPRRVIENLYGEAVFFEDAFDEIWGDAYDAALHEHDLQAVDKPQIDIEKIDLTEGVKFTAEVQLMPTVTLGAYKGIEVEVPSYTVGDAEVDAAINAEREKNARFIDVDRAVENGDRVVLDYSGTVNGEKFDGGTAEDQTLVIGSGAFIPGFEEQLVGMKAGEQKDISVKFPDDYAEQMAGKDAVFAINIKAVQKKELPELDDEFAKDVSEFDTLSALREDKKKTLTEQAEEHRKNAVESACVKAVTDAASVEIPKVMVDRQINYMLQDMAYRLASSGLSIEDYAKYMGVTMEQMREGYRESAQDRVKMQLVIEAVGKAEQVACTDEDLNKKIEEYAKSNGQTAEEFSAKITDDDREYLSDRVVAEKTVQMIIDGAKVKDAKPDDDKKAAKKAPAKKKAAPKKAETESAE